MEGERIIYIHVKVKIERELLTASRSSINLCLTCVNPGYSMKGKAETVVARVKVKKFFHFISSSCLCLSIIQNNGNVLLAFCLRKDEYFFYKG